MRHLEDLNKRRWSKGYTPSKLIGFWLWLFLLFLKIVLSENNNKNLYLKLAIVTVLQYNLPTNGFHLGMYYWNKKWSNIVSSFAKYFYSHDKSWRLGSYISIKSWADMFLLNFVILRHFWSFLCIKMLKNLVPRIISFSYSTRCYSP